MIKSIDTTKPVCLDIETTGLDRHRCDITSIQIGFTHVDTGEYTRKFFNYKKLGMERVKLLMEKLKECKLVTHNGKFDLLFLYEKTGISLSLWIDTLVLAHVCGEHPLGLKPLTEKYFHVSYDIEKEAKVGEITEEFKAYGLDDVLYPMKLLEIFREKVTRYGLLKVFKHEMRAYKAYYEIEKHGVPISPRRFEVKAKLEAELKPYAEKLLTYGDINWNSTDQVASILFTEKDQPVYKEKGEKLPNSYLVLEGSKVITEVCTRKEAKEFIDTKGMKATIKLKHNFKPVVIGYGQGLEVIEKTDKGKPSVGVDTLANYRGNDCVDTLLEYKRLTKLLTFINSWEELQVNNKIYPSFNITARTGRTTCSNPNLQQCPQDSYVRNLIEARPGYKILECFSGDTEVLAKDGWQRFDNLSKSVELAQYDIVDGTIDFTKPLNYIHQEGRATYKYEDRHTSLCVTSNHNVLTTWGKGYSVKKEVFSETSFSRGHAFINAGKYDNASNRELQSRYIAMFTADGSMNSKGYVTYSFSKDRKVERCKRLLDALGIEYTIGTYKRNNPNYKDNVNFYIGKRSNYLLNGYVGRDKKLSMDCIHKLDLEAFLDEASYWDATKTRAKCTKSIRFSTTVKETIEVMQLMCALTGRKSTIRVDEHNYNKSKGYHKKNYYITYKVDGNDTYTFMSGLTPDFKNPVYQDVYCATMPKGTLVIRHNGKISIQGNCDFSQAELRVASWFSGDENMQHAYQSGSDLHSKTTELLFGDTSTLGHDEQKRLRTYSKSMNFGFLYGMSAKTFVDYAKGYGLNLSQEESEKLRNDFFTAYPRLLPWHEECKEFARRHGYVVSPIGRKRWFDNIHSNDFKKRAGDERQSINSTVQGFASDMCISALADIVFSKELDHSKFTVLGSVHDAILLEAREDYAEELGKKVQEIMEHPSIAEDLDIPVPMKADLEISQSWGGH